MNNFTITKRMIPLTTIYGSFNTTHPPLTTNITTTNMTTTSLTTIKPTTTPTTTMNEGLVFGVTIPAGIILALIILLLIVFLYKRRKRRLELRRKLQPVYTAPPENEISDYMYAGEDNNDNIIVSFDNDEDNLLQQQTEFHTFPPA